MTLCQICSKLNIRKLLLLANEDGFSKYETVDDKLEKANATTPSDDFFPHHPSPEAVRDAASTCDLCSAIWRDYVYYRATPYTNPGAADSRYASSLTAPTGADLSIGQVYITAAPRNTASHGKSQIVAFAQGRNSSLQILGWFDVYTERRTTPSPLIHGCD